MKNIHVKDLMVPVDDFITIDEDLPLTEVVIELRNAINVYAEKNLFYGSVLVQDKNKKIIGKINGVDIIKVLEPKYSKLAGSAALSETGVSHFGLSPDYIRKIVSRYDLWSEDLDSMIKHASSYKAKDIMASPSDGGGHIYETSSIADAIHQMALNYQSSLVVEKDDKITGVIRLKSIFTEICNIIEKNNK